MRQAHEQFQSRDIFFVDCPVSGGPVRALKGELTMMASGDEASLDLAKPLLDAMGSKVHVVAGGAGMSSTVKVRITTTVLEFRQKSAHLITKHCFFLYVLSQMVHQLLAGVHICCAAEALALAAKKCTKLSMERLVPVGCLRIAGSE